MGHLVHVGTISEIAGTIILMIGIISNPVGCARIRYVLEIGMLAITKFARGTCFHCFAYAVYTSWVTQPVARRAEMTIN